MVEPIRLDYAANDAEVIAAFKRQQAEMERERAARAALQRQINDNAKTQKDADREFSEGQREAQRVLAKTQTVQEKYAAAVSRLDDLHRKGHLTVEQYTRAVDQEKQSLSDATAAVDKQGSSVDGLGTKLLAVGATGAAAWKQIASAVKDTLEEMARVNIDYDKMSRKFGIQGGLSDADRKRQSRLVGKVATDAAVDISKAFEVSTQLSSSGFADPVNNGTLDTALALMQGSNQIEGDVAGFVKGSGQFLNAFGRKKDRASLSELGVRMAGLFKSTDVQAADLTEFAKAAPVLSGANISMGDSLSLLTALRESMNAGEAATGVRNVVSMLQTSGANQTAVKALQSVGLTPDQIDIQGEGVTTSLNRLKMATGRLGEADRAQVLTQIFGRENTAAAGILLNSTDKLAGYNKMQVDAAPQFAADVQTARQGLAAADIRNSNLQIMDATMESDRLLKETIARQDRERKQKARVQEGLNRGGVMGMVKAGANIFTNAIDDNIVRPIIGETTDSVMAKKNFEVVTGTGASAAPVPVQLPPEMQENMKLQNKLIQQQIEQTQKEKQARHAGIISNRASNQKEGGL